MKEKQSIAPSSNDDGQRKIINDDIPQECTPRREALEKQQANMEQELTDMVSERIKSPEQLERVFAMLDEFDSQLDTRISLNEITNIKKEIKKLEGPKNKEEDSTAFYKRNQERYKLEDGLEEAQKELIDRFLDEKNLEQAEKIADGMRGDHSQQKIYKQIITEKIANENLDGAKTTLRKITNGYFKVPCLIQFAEKYYKDDFKKSSELKITQAKETARDIKDPFTSVLTMIKIAESESGNLSNVKQAEATLQEAKKVITNALIERESGDEMILLSKIDILLKIAIVEKKTGCKEYEETIKQCEKFLAKIKDSKIKTETLANINEVRAEL